MPGLNAETKGLVDNADLQGKNRDYVLIPGAELKRLVIW